MGNFPGGSAWAMAKDIAESVLLPTERTYVRLTQQELEQLAFELDRALREVRGNQPSLEDQAALQQRNRKITRLNQALAMLRAFQSRRRPRLSTERAGGGGGSKPGGPRRPPGA